MKSLLKKLLPVATLASTIAVAAPMASCSSYTVELLDISKYASTVDQHQEVVEESAWDVSKANQEYFKNSNAANIIKNDVLLFIKDALIKTNAETSTTKAGFGGLKINEKSDKGCFLLDFTIMITNVSEDTEAKVTIESSTTCHMSGIPYCLMYTDGKIASNAGEKRWVVTPCETVFSESSFVINANKWADYNQNWKIEYNLTQTQKVNNKVMIDITSNTYCDKDNTETIELGSFTPLATGCIYSSNYLAKVKGK